MNGRMRPYLPELTIRDYNTYLRYLRGVRRQLYEEYGFYACHLLRTNGVLFAILSDSLAGRAATCQRKRVPGTLVWRKLMCQTQGIRLAAQVEVLLGWHSLQDRKYSELSFPKQVQRAFDRLMRGRTSFVVAHRLSTVRDADLICVVDQGRIAERGTHEELLAQDGLYRQIYESQFAPAE